MSDATERDLAGRRPDWVIVGAPTDGGGVMVLASKDLTKAELEAVSGPWIIDWDLSNRPPESSLADITLHVGLKRYTVVYAATYSEAFRDLRPAEILP